MNSDNLNECSTHNTLNIINKNNLNIILNLFNKKNKAIFFGKGPSFEIPSNKNINEIYICVNETVNFIDNCDLLAVNDIEAFNIIDLKKLKNIKNIIMPYHIHSKSKFNINITYKNALEKIKNYFDGNLIIYNLNTSKKKYDNFINISSTWTSIHTSTEFVLKYLKIKNCKFIGVCSGDGYSHYFTNRENKKDKVHSNSRIIKYKEALISFKKKYNAEFEFKKAKITKEFFEKNYSIFILRHINNDITNKYWLYNYNCIREHYKNIKIIIIDNNSSNIFLEKDKDYPNIEFIYHNESKDGEYLLYYHYFLTKYTKYALLIHDSVFIHKQIHNLICEDDFIPLWSFKSDMIFKNYENLVIKLLNKLNYSDELIQINKKKNLWDGTFGCMSIISIKYLNNIFNKYKLENLLNNINNRPNRMCFERIISIIYYHNNNKNVKFLINNIHKWLKNLNLTNKAWGSLTWNNYHNNNKLKNLNIVKVWSGR